MNRGFIVVIADFVDRVAVVRQVTLRIHPGVSGLAQHIEGVAVTLGPPFARVAKGFLHGPAEHELTAHQPHSRADRLTDDWLAGACHQLLDRALQIPAGPTGVLAHAHDPPGQHQAPAGRIDEQRVRFSDMALPIAGRDLVGDQPVGGFAIGHAQQSLGQTHEGDALLGR